MIAYIYTDASFYPDEKVGGFAFWIECGSRFVKMSGALENVKNSTEAETMCICNALFTFKEQDYKRIKDIIIVTDSRESILKIKRKPRAKSETVYKYCNELLMEIRHDNRIRNKVVDNFRHVQAHKGVSSIDQIYNNWCDREAKRAAKEYIKTLKSKQ